MAQKLSQLIIYISSLSQPFVVPLAKLKKHKDEKSIWRNSQNVRVCVFLLSASSGVRIVNPRRIMKVTRKT